MAFRVVSVACVPLVILLAGCDSSSSSSAPVAEAAAPTPVATPSATPTATAPADEPPPTAIAAQHILVAYKGAKGAPKSITRSKVEARKRAEDVLARVRGGDDFTQLVKTYTDDAGSADRLGSVGKFTREKMDKSFSDAAFALKVDEVSAVVETPFGFHLIKRNQ